MGKGVESLMLGGVIKVPRPTGGFKRKTAKTYVAGGANC
jgi:hypothetical protein